MPKKPAKPQPPPAPPPAPPPQPAKAYTLHAETGRLGASMGRLTSGGL